MELLKIEVPDQRSLKTMTKEAQKGFRGRSRARRQTVRYKAEVAYQNLIKDLGLAQVDSNRTAVQGFEGVPHDAKSTRSTNEALSALLYVFHRLESGDEENRTGLVPQARRILKQRRADVETNRKRDRKRVIGERYLAKLAAIKNAPHSLAQ